jgi:hypothetical protein
MQWLQPLDATTIAQNLCALKDLAVMAIDLHQRFAALLPATNTVQFAKLDIPEITLAHTGFTAAGAATTVNIIVYIGNLPDAAGIVHGKHPKVPVAEGAGYAGLTAPRKGFALDPENDKIVLTPGMTLALPDRDKRSFEGFAFYKDSASATDDPIIQFLRGENN